MGNFDDTVANSVPNGESHADADAAPFIAHDRDYFLRRAAEARQAASAKDISQTAQVAGDLALAYAALARRRAAPVD